MDDCPPSDSGDGRPAAAESREREAYLDALRAAVKRGLEDIKAGRTTDPERTMDGIEAMLDELEAAAGSTQS